MQPIFENRGRSVIDILRKKNTDEKQEREIRGFEWLGESLLSLGVQDPIVFEVGHAFASRQPVLESKVDSAARILSTYNTPQSQDLSGKLRTLMGKKAVPMYNELKLYENPAFIAPDEEAVLRMRFTRNRSSEPLTFTQMFEDVYQYVRELSFMKNQSEETTKRLVFENLFRDGRIREDIREMSSMNIGRIIGDNLWEQVKSLEYQNPLILVEAVKVEFMYPGFREMDVDIAIHGKRKELEKLGRAIHTAKPAIRLLPEASPPYSDHTYGQLTAMGLSQHDDYDMTYHLKLKAESFEAAMARVQQIIQESGVITESVTSGDVASSAQSQGAAPETNKKYEFSPEEIQRLKDVFASGPLRYKPTVDNRLLKLSVIRYGKGGKHVEPVEGSWSDTYLDSGLLSSAEGPKKQITQESIDVQGAENGFLLIKCETVDEADLVADALTKAEFETYTDDQDPMILKVRVYQIPNAEDEVRSVLKVAGLYNDIEDYDDRNGQDRDVDMEETKVKDVSGERLDEIISKEDQDALVKRYTEDEDVRVIHLADHPKDFLNIPIQIKETDGTVRSESKYGEFLLHNDDETDGIPKELTGMEPGEVRNIGGGAAPEFILVMKDKSGVWERRVSESEVALIADQIIHYMMEPSVENLSLRSESGVSVAELAEKRLGRREYDNDDEDHEERGKCHRKGHNAHKDMKLRKKLRTLLDKDKVGDSALVTEVESKKA